MGNSENRRMTTTSPASAKPFPYRFADLVDLHSFGKVLDNFYRATGIANGVVDASGELLTQSGWTQACTVFHRGHADSNAQCIASNLKLMGSLQKGCIHSDLCLNGLSDYATPVTIEGHPLATLFLGQVLHTPPDLDRFRQQAHRFSYDTESYLTAIQAIPVLPQAQVESLMTVMVSMAEMLAASGLARLRQKALEQNISESNERRIQLEDILDASPVATGWSHNDGHIEYINQQFTHLFGYTLSDLPDLATWYHLAYPDANYREQVIQPWNEQVLRARNQGTSPPELVAPVTCKNGQIRHVNIRVSWVGERRLVNFSDVTELWESKQRIQAHDAMLDMVARGVDLPTILHAVVQQVEAEDPSARCSILLLDDQNCLRTAAAPNLPAFYSQAINGAPIGPRAGSCGTAAYTGQRVIVEDITTDSLWTDYASLAESAHLRACWSEPILSSHGKVLGTFAIYHAEPAVPSATDIKRIASAANLCAVAIENRNTHQALERRANTDELTSLPNRRAFHAAGPARTGAPGTSSRLVVRFDAGHRPLQARERHPRTPSWRRRAGGTRPDVQTFVEGMRPHGSHWRRRVCRLAPGHECKPRIGNRRTPSVDAGQHAHPIGAGHALESHRVHWRDHHLGRPGHRSAASPSR